MRLDASPNAFSNKQRIGNLPRNFDKAICDILSNMPSLQFSHLTPEGRVSLTMIQFCKKIMQNGRKWTIPHSQCNQCAKRTHNRILLTEYLIVHLQIKSD